MPHKDIHAVRDLRRLAKRRLPKMVFDALDGGAEDEQTLAANLSGFGRLSLLPRHLVDVSVRNQETTVLGQRISMPVMLAPTGSARLAAADAELTLARQARRVGTLYTHSSVASYPLHAVAAEGRGNVWYQLYLPHDRNAAKRLLQQIEDAGYGALVLTVDTAVRGSRERDDRNGFVLPYRISPALVAAGLSRPRWSAQFVAGNAWRPKSETSNMLGQRASLREVEEQITAKKWPVTWADVEFVRKVWRGPLVLKGVLNASDSRRMVDAGADGLVVSNHGGRQLDGAPATIDVLPEVVSAVDGSAEVYLDGGVRRGSDVVKAVALGARACFVGRPYLFALAARGEPGLEAMFDCFRTEIDRVLALLGCCSMEDLHPGFVRSR